MTSQLLFYEKSDWLDCTKIPQKKCKYYNQKSYIWVSSTSNKHKKYCDIFGFDTKLLQIVRIQLTKLVSPKLPMMLHH